MRTFQEVERWQDLPEACGVYIWLGSDDQILYIGASKNLLKRHSGQGQCHNGTGGMLRWVNVTRFRYCIGFDSYQDTLAAESLMIAALKPIFNTNTFRDDFIRSGDPRI